MNGINVNHAKTAQNVEPYINVIDNSANFDILNMNTC